MKRYLSYQIYIALIVILIAAKAPAAAADVDEAVNRVQKQLSSFVDIQGRFSQSSYIVDIDETQEYSGRFYLKKPSYMMWEYSKPRDEKVVMKDSDTWIYKKSQKQVIRTTFNKGSYSQIPIAMLSGMEHIKDDFEITMPEKNALQLVPRDKSGHIKTLLIEITEGNFPIKMFTMFDTYGNIIMIELQEIKTNSNLEDSFFDLKTPPGVEIFDMRQ